MKGYARKAKEKSWEHESVIWISGEIGQSAAKAWGCWVMQGFGGQSKEYVHSPTGKQESLSTLTKLQCVHKTKAQRSRICWASSTWNSKAIQEESYLQPVVRNPTCTFKNQKGAKNPKGRHKVNEGCTESYLNIVMWSHPDSLTLPSALHPFWFGGFHTWNAPASAPWPLMHSGCQSLLRVSFGIYFWLPGLQERQYRVQCLSISGPYYQHLNPISASLNCCVIWDKCLKLYEPIC